MSERFRQNLKQRRITPRVDLIDHIQLVHRVHTQERDKDTVNPIPHSVFKRFQYPKTGFM